MSGQRPVRTRLVGATVAVSIVVVAAAIALSSTSTSSPTRTTGIVKGPAAVTVAQQVQRFLAGIPQRGTTLGDPLAPVTIDYYGDLECPVCQAFTLDGAFPQLVADDVRAGRVKIVYRSLCTATCNGPGPRVFTAQQGAAYAAGLQERFWQYAELFYREQGPEDSGYVTGSYLDGLARQVPGLDMVTWFKHLAGPQVYKPVAADERAAARLRLTGTPSLVVIGARGRVVLGNGVPDLPTIQAAIQHVG